MFRAALWIAPILMIATSSARAEVPLESFAEAVTQEQIDTALSSLLSGADDLSQAIVKAAALPTNPLAVVLVQTAGDNSCPIRLRAINPGTDPIFSAAITVRQARSLAELELSLIHI